MYFVWRRSRASCDGPLSGELVGSFGMKASWWSAVRPPLRLEGPVDVAEEGGRGRGKSWPSSVLRSSWLLTTVISCDVRLLFLPLCCPSCLFSCTRVVGKPKEARRDKGRDVCTTRTRSEGCLVRWRSSQREKVEASAWNRQPRNLGAADLVVVWLEFD